MEKPSKNMIEWALDLAVSNIRQYCKSPLLRFSKYKSLTNRSNNYIFCYVGKEPAGFITFRFSKDTAYVFELHVEENYRSQGIGTLLLNECKVQYNEIVGRVVLYVYRENTRGLEFYRRNGFEINKEYKCNKFYEMVLNKRD